MAEQCNICLLKNGHALLEEKLAMMENSARNVERRNLRLLLHGNVLYAEKKAMMENSVRIVERKEGNRYGEQ